MKAKNQSGSRFENRATVALGVVLLVLTLNLAFGNPLFKLLLSGGVNASTRPAPPPPVTPVGDRNDRAASAGASKPTSQVAAKTQDEFARYDPALDLDALKAVLSRPAPKMERNPFELEATAQQTINKNEPPPQPPPPPPPPPIPLKAVGYSEKPGVKEAYITDDQEVYVVHEGEEFGKRYKVLKITPQQIEVEDQTSHQTGQLVVPQ